VADPTSKRSSSRAAAAAAVAAAAAAAGPPPLAKAETDSLHSAGSRVKFLVDTPEKIWGSLEEREFLGAAKRFLAARDVLECLESATAAAAADCPGGAELASATQSSAPISRVVQSESSAATADESPVPPMPYERLVALFPLVQQQGPLLDSFRAQIARRGRAGLEPPGLTPRECASALAAVVAVENLSGDEALRLLLQTKRAWLRATLRRVGTAAPPEKVAAALARVLTEVRHVVVLLQYCFVGVVDTSEEYAANKDEEGSGGGLSLATRGVDGLSLDGGRQLSASQPISSSGGSGSGARGLGDGSGSGGASMKGGGGGAGRQGGGRDVRVSATDGAPLVFAALLEADPLGTTFTGVSDPAREIVQWVRRTRARGEALVPPPLSAIADECRRWLEGAAADVAQAAHSRGLLAGVAYLADLARLERDVVNAAATATAATDWLGNAELAFNIQSEAAPATHVRSDAATAASERACVAVLGRPLDAWAALVEASHVSRAMELLSEALSHAPLRTALDAALASLPPPAPRDTPLQPPPEVRDIWGETYATSNNLVGAASVSSATTVSGGSAGVDADADTDVDIPRGSDQGRGHTAPAPAAVRLAIDLAGTMAAVMAAARKV